MNDTERSDRGRERDDEPVLPQLSRDEQDAGWGDDPRQRRRDAEWYERERPPHHG